MRQLGVSWDGLLACKTHSHRTIELFKTAGDTVLLGHFEKDSVNRGRRDADAVTGVCDSNRKSLVTGGRETSATSDHVTDEADRRRQQASELDASRQAGPIVSK